MLCSIAKKSISRCEMKNINNNKTKASKKRRYDRSNSSSEKSYYDSSIFRDIDWDKERHPDGCREINILDKVVTDHINKDKDQHNEAIENDPKFDCSFNLSITTKYPLLVVSVSLLGGKKHGATTVNGLTCLWDSGATNIMIKIRHTKYYDCKMRSNKVEYCTSTGFYSTTHDVKVTFWMPDFSSNKIINRRFHVNSNNGESGISYDTIIGRDLMVKLGLTAKFKR